MSFAAALSIGSIRKGGVLSEMLSGCTAVLDIRIQRNLARENPCLSDASGRWTRSEVEQVDDLLQELHDLVEMFHGLLKNPGKNGRLHATPEVSLRLVVSLCDWRAVA